MVILNSMILCFLNDIILCEIRREKNKFDRSWTFLSPNLISFTWALQLRLFVWLLNFEFRQILHSPEMSRVCELKMWCKIIELENLGRLRCRAYCVVICTLKIFLASPVTLFYSVNRQKSEVITIIMKWFP